MIGNLTPIGNKKAANVIFISPNPADQAAQKIRLTG
jgi:hypothetical protein